MTVASAPQSGLLPETPHTILVLGGTTEGRLAARVLDAAGSPYIYSTRGTMQEVELHGGLRHTGALDAEAMTALCLRAGVRLLIDAAHPFAEQLHQTVEEVASQLDVPVVRLEREYPELQRPCVACSSFAEAVDLMQRAGVRRLLALTGVQTIGRLRPFWSAHGADCWVRILDRPQSWQQAAAEGFPSNRLLTPATPDDAIPAVDAILTKESGLSGGFDDKVRLAGQRGVPLYVIRRPPTPAGWTVVTGEHGLRRAVEVLCPGFFPLRSGFTTGSCATAAAVAALRVLLGRDPAPQVRFRLPDGERMEMAVARTTHGASWAEASVVKDAGDDPDVTHGTTIVARVGFSGSAVEPVAILGGEGVGRVTLPGLGLPVGEAAINPVPRQMLCQNLRALYQGGLRVEISVPEGRRLAARTFNSRVGVVDGISIIGTRGIVQPLSASALVEAVRRQLDVAWAMGIRDIVLNSGARSEDAVRALRPGLPPQAFVHYGNFIGDALRAAHDVGFRRATLAIMIGKAVKLAAGHLDTHSHKVVMDRDFLARLAADAGCSAGSAGVIGELTLARELPRRLDPHDWQRLAAAITAACHRTAAPVFPDGELQVILL